MEIKLDQLEMYRESLQIISDDAKIAAKKELWDLVAKTDFNGGPQAIKEFRSAVIDIVKAIEDTYGLSSASVGSMFYDWIMSEVELPTSSVDFHAANDEQIKKSVHYWMKDIASDTPDPDKFVAGILSFVERTVYHASDIYIADAAKHAYQDGIKIKFARVPTGPTCPFCIMLASRGFVYATPETAGEFTQYHDKCDCHIIAGYEGLQVEGYDYETMYAHYKSCRDTVTNAGGEDPVWRMWSRMPDDEKSQYVDARGNERSYNKFLESQILQEMSTRDRRWLYDGTEAPITFANEDLKKEIFKERRQEYRTAQRLSKIGLPVNFQVDTYTVQAGGQIRLKGLSDLGNGYELKTLKDASTFNTVDGYIRGTSKKKKGVSAIVFDNYENDEMEDKTLIKHILRSRRFHDGRIYIIDHNGNLRLIRERLMQ